MAFFWYFSDAWAKALNAQIDRIENKLDVIIKDLTRMEKAAMAQYDAELTALEAQAKANEDIEDSATATLAAVSQLVAALKTGQTDPATAARITALAEALKGHSDPLGAAVAATPTS
jgi:ATP/maltotriose-dependent transcriptional regulator MalT